MTMTPDPIETALLARLLVQNRRPPSANEILRSLRPFFDGADATTTARLETTLARLATDGLRTDEMKLTAKGRERVCDALGVPASKLPTQWRAVRRLLVEVALGQTGRRRSKPLSAAGIRAAAMAGKLGLPTTSTRPAEVLDAWAARELGMDGQRLTIANVRAYALSRALGIGSLRDPKRIGAVASAQILGVPRIDAGNVRDAVLRDWLRGHTDAKARSTAQGDGDLLSFAAAVKEVARATNERFGRFKVFIGPLWNHAREAASFARMNEHDFKAKLVEAHRAGLLHLARADLTPAMEREVVAASEVPYLNAVFHFVDLEGSLS